MSCTPDQLPTTWQVPDYDVQAFQPKRTRYCIGIPIINEGERIRSQLAEMFEQGLPERAFWQMVVVLMAQLQQMS